MMKKILITGGIGSGKSEVSKILKNMGYPVADADRFARDILQQPDIQKKINQLFHENVFLPNGEMDRAKVRQKILEKESLRVALENITHPAITQKREELVKELEQKSHQEYFFYEASLILEKKRQDEFDAVFLVTADTDTRRNRIIKNRGLSKEHVQKIMAAQMPETEKAKFANFVITNQNLSLAQLKERVAEILTELKSSFTK